jgi:hypothetical protein
MASRKPDYHELGEIHEHFAILEAETILKT